jgi:secreted trypsin-like serine protease
VPRTAAREGTADLTAHPKHGFDVIAARLSRRTTAVSLLASLFTFTVQNWLPTLARRKATKGKPGRKKLHRKNDNQTHGVTPEIVGGASVPAGKYPFQVAIMDKRYGDKGFKRQFCGGSLIDAWHVLTAAHCVARRDKTNPVNLRVIVGITILNRRQGELRQVANVTVHPDYNGKSMRNDVAVLRLAEPIDLSAFPPIKLINSGDEGLEAPGTLLTVIGWGSIRKHVAGKKKNKPPKYSHGLREVRVPVVADDACAHDYGTKRGMKVSTDVMICAGQAGLDSCAGDSGGPLFATTPDGYVQVGIVSWGSGCAAPQRPGVYTRVSAVADFIRHAVADTSRFK